MLLQRFSSAVRPQRRIIQTLARATASTALRHGVPPRRGFHATRALPVVKPVLLADIGEGIVECEIIQWFVEPEARVEEFSPLCEVQSDKASVEITSRFDGVVKKLYYDAGELAKVGKPFVDIDIQGDAKKEDLEALTATPTTTLSPGVDIGRPTVTPPPPPPKLNERENQITPETVSAIRGDSGQNKNGVASLATPAVRHLSKEVNVDINDISGTGKDGRVLKEDIYKFLERKDTQSASNATPKTPLFSSSRIGAAAPLPEPLDIGAQKETRVPMTATQQHMFKTMTRSLTIPHFLFADEIDFTHLSALRSRLNKVLANPSTGATNGMATPATSQDDITKLTYLPFIIKAVSMALYQYPILNARVEIDPSAPPPGSKPVLVHREHHNIGVAMDTPSGLVVPVIKGVHARSVLSVARELRRLQGLALRGRLSPADLAGGTLTVSNVGNIGGTYLSPVVVEGEVAILGVGRVRTVPAFEDEGVVGGVGGENLRVVKRQMCNFSWSADHRVVDGATLARAAGVVRQVVEEPEVMLMHLR